VVWVLGDVTSGSQFRSFIGLEKYFQLMKWISKAKPKGQFTLKTKYHCQLSDEAAQDTRVMVRQEFCGSDWNPETWNDEVQNICAVAPEAVTLLIEANLWYGDRKDPPANALLVEEPKTSNDAEGVSKEHLK
jgi:hypothetical protein